MADKVWKGGYALCFWVLQSISFFDANTRSIRKGWDGEWWGEILWNEI